MTLTAWIGNHRNLPQALVVWGATCFGEKPDFSDLRANTQHRLDAVDSYPRE